MNGDDFLPASLRLSRFNTQVDYSMQQLEQAVNEVPVIPEEGAAPYWYVDPSAPKQYDPMAAYWNMVQSADADENERWAQAMGLL